MSELTDYEAKSGKFVPVWTIEIQTLPEDIDRILDAVMQVHPLSFGRYQRNASISAVGKETAQPEAGSTTTHVDGFKAGGTETYPMVELKISIERDAAILEKVMDAIILQDRSRDLQGLGILGDSERVHGALGGLRGLRHRQVLRAQRARLRQRPDAHRDHL